MNRYDVPAHFSERQLEIADAMIYVNPMLPQHRRKMPVCPKNPTPTIGDHQFDVGVIVSRTFWKKRGEINRAIIKKHKLIICVFMTGKILKKKGSGISPDPSLLVK